MCPTNGAYLLQQKIIAEYKNNKEQKDGMIKQLVNTPNPCVKLLALIIFIMHIHTTDR